MATGGFLFSGFALVLLGSASSLFPLVCLAAANISKAWSSGALSFNPRRSDTGVGFFSVDMAPGSQWPQVVEVVLGESLTAFVSSLDLCFTSRRRIGYLALLRW